MLARSGSVEMSQREMSKRLGKDPAAISRAVRYLQSQGFIERHQVSGCKNSVSLTPKAKSLQPRIEQIIRVVTTDACREMSSDQISAGLVFLMGLLKYKP
ncbi:MAG: MarR family transcriptional regulator [Paramuribaculum sp.]|nr:MarR family transcriptional regulator [Paramuribaculum sp.]